MMTSNERSGPDRRRTPRVDTDFYGSVDGAGLQHRCRVTNLSRVGACAIAPKPWVEMARVRLRLTNKDESGDVRVAHVEAAVVRCQRRADGQFDVGLFFTEVAAEDETTLGKIIERFSLATATP